MILCLGVRTRLGSGRKAAERVLVFLELAQHQKNNGQEIKNFQVLANFIILLQESVASVPYTKSLLESTSCFNYTYTDMNICCVPTTVVRCGRSVCAKARTNLVEMQRTVGTGKCPSHLPCEALLLCFQEILSFFKTTGRLGKPPNFFFLTI